MLTLLSSSHWSHQVRLADENGTAWCIGVIPGKSERVEDISQWIQQLNNWAASQIADWEQNSEWQAAPTDSSYESWAHRGGAELIAYGGTPYASRH